MKNILFLFALTIIVAMSSCDKTTTTTDLGATTVVDTTKFYIDSDAVVDGKLLSTYKCESKTNNIENSIPLEWGKVPATAQSLLIMMYHFPNPTDTVNANSYLHLWNISPTVTSIPYGMADDGAWYIGSNKDGTAISYTSPCSPTSATHQYHITIYALDAVPASLPTQNSLSVNYSAVKAALGTVNIIDKVTLTFNDVTL